MLTVSRHIRFLFLTTGLLLFLSASIFTAPFTFVSAQEACGNVIDRSSGEEEIIPIEDCDNPFGVPHGDPISVRFGSMVLEDGGMYSLLGQDEGLFFDNVDPRADFTFATLYKHEGEDYVRESIFDSYLFAEQGVYTLVLTSAELILVHDEQKSLFQKLAQFFVTPVYAAHGGLQLTILTFEIEGEGSAPLDPLILKYEPILYLHPDENYRPMNVEAFVGASALWDDRGILTDVKLKERGEVTIGDLNNENSEDWYLTFSGNEAKSFDLSVAKSRYNQLVANGNAELTYYARRMEDGDYTVLQYWYFYAFNDWKDHGGVNNHEGDWESVFVFLDKDTEEPKYVAYSSHLNDGDPGDSFAQYDSVRRKWGSDEVTKENEQVISFVALGSHANYPNNGVDGMHVVPGFFEDKVDKTSENTDTRLVSEDWALEEEIPTILLDWIKYEGKWGADTTVAGADGPQGPLFLAPSFGGAVIRFHNPVEWAGIGNDVTKTVATETKTLSFLGSNTVMTFVDLLSPGTTVSVDMHDENISFGENLDEVDLLPHFWDLNSNLLNNTFEVSVSFKYNPAELEARGAKASDLEVFLFNTTEKVWESVAGTIIDEINNTVSFVTTHFSRYAVGVEAPRTLEELYDDVIQGIEELSLEPRRKERLVRQVQKVRDPHSAFYRERRKGRMFRSLLGTERRLQRYKDAGRIVESIDQILVDLREIRERLENS